MGKVHDTGNLPNYWKEIINFSDVAIIGKTLDGIITNWNHGAERLYGYRSDEVLNKSISLIIPKGSIDELPYILNELKKGRHIDDLEVVRVRKDGKQLLVLISISPIRDDEGKIIGAATFTRDISKRKRIELALKESENNFRLLADSMPQIVWTADECGWVDYFNQKWLDYSGMSLEKSRGWGWEDQVYPDDLSKLLDVWTVSIETGEDYEMEYRLKRKDGEYRWHLGRALPIKNSSGEVIKWFGTNTDIHDEKLYEEELQKSRDLLDIIFQNVTNGIIVYNGQEVVYVNQAIADIFELNDTEEFKKIFPHTIEEKFELYSESGVPFALAESPTMRALNGEVNAKKIYRYVNTENGKEKWLVSTSRPVLDNAKKIVFVITIINDITEEKLAQQRKDEFVSMASHELKTPLTSVKAFTQIMEKMAEAKNFGNMTKYLQKMDTQIVHITRLIEDLLNLPYINKGIIAYQGEYFDLDALVREIAETFRLTAEGYKIILEGRADKQIFGDKERIGQVIINLLTNAVKYSSPGSKIIIKTQAEGHKEVRFSVTDFGIGIPKKDQEKIFTRFYRVKRKNSHNFPGLGVGLYISSEIIKRHRGNIGVDSENNKGSTFYFTLPIK